MSLTGREIGHYHILEPLGEGGMAVVYKAYDTHLDRTVALKMIRVNAFPADSLAQIQQRFEREAKALARLSHPNIVGVIDFGKFEGAPYLVMEFLAGGSLKKILEQSQPWQQAVRLLLPIARALAYAHSQNIIHRDIKPSNILITHSGEPMLTDFGIAKILDLGPGQTLTSTGVGIGTPEYMAPEQGMGQEVDVRADVYALGVVLYEMVTGRRPYEADTPVAVVFKHIMDPLPNPRLFAPDLPEGVEQALIKALAKQPVDRFQTMEAFVHALENLGGIPTRQEAAPAVTTLPTTAAESAPVAEPAAPPVHSPAPDKAPHPPPAPSQPGSAVPRPQPPSPAVGQPWSAAPPPPAPVLNLQPPQPGAVPGRGAALPPPVPLHPARPYKKQPPAWLVVVVTLILMALTSFICMCLISGLLSEA